MHSNTKISCARDPKLTRVSAGGSGHTQGSEINYFSFEVQNKATKGGLNTDTVPDSVPQCLCAEALPKFLTELLSLRIKFPTKRILMSKADVSDAFRNVRIDPDEATSSATR